MHRHRVLGLAKAKVQMGTQNRVGRSKLGGKRLLKPLAGRAGSFVSLRTVVRPN